MKRLAVAAVFGLVLVGCNAGPNRTNIEVIQNMMDQVSIKSQDWNPAEGDKGQMRTPPEGAIARGHAPYKYAGDPVAAERDVNPYAADRAPELTAQGRKYYDIYCMVCHGADGAGAGPVAERMAVKPRNLISSEALGYSEGRIFYAITAGRGVMGSYASQIPDIKTRWAIVNYIRTLQKK